MVKISITYLYTILKYGYPPRIQDDFQALEEIGQMGFRYLEMESLGPEHGRQVWEHRDELKKRLDDLDIHVHNFCGVDKDLVSLDKTKRQQAYERFKRTAELATELGAETLHLASYSPPVEYIEGEPYALGQAYRFGDNARIKIPQDFSWEALWQVLVESCCFTATVAAEYNRTIIMEPRVGEIICSVDSLIRLIHDVGRDNFKANFDTANFSAQRENIPLALMKLESLYANIHLADNNPHGTEHLPVGKGVIDWYEFFDVLKRQNYQGYLGLDLGSKETIVEDLRESVVCIQKVAADRNVDIAAPNID